MANPSNVSVLGPYAVHVNRAFTFVQMIETGGYDNRNRAVKEITDECFPMDRAGTLEVEKELFLVPPSRNGLTTTTEWKTELEANGWVLEQAPELLALGAKYPDLQLEYCIFAFGSSCRNPHDHLHRFPVPALWSDNGFDGRGVGVLWCEPDGSWSTYNRALVSRKR